MASHEGLALVLDSKDYRETSSLVRLLTEGEGKISVIAKGLRKGKGGAGPATVQAFSMVRVRYFLKEGATLGNLAGVDLEQAFTAVRNSIEAYALVSYWFEILKETSQPREGTHAIFHLSVRLLRTQETHPGLTLEYLDQISDLCRLLGFGLSWADCAACGSPVKQPRRFSIRSGGVLCDECIGQGTEGLMLRPEEVLAIQGLAVGSDQANSSLAPAGLLPLLGIVNRYLTYHIEHPLRTFVFVESIFKT